MNGTSVLRLASILWLMGLLSACASVPQTRSLGEHPPALPAVAGIASLPFFPQEALQCGPAALATLLVHGGIETTPETLAPYVFLPGREGSLQVDIVAAARSHGRLVHQLPPRLETLLAEVAAGHPVLVLQNLGLDWLPRWHYAVVKGYDLGKGKLLLNSGRNEDYELKLAIFERTWARADHWALVVLPTDQLPATATPGAVFTAAVALQESGQDEAGLAVLETALERWPDATVLLMGAGNLQLAQGDGSAAEARYRRVLELEPGYAPAHNNLALLLRDRGEIAEARLHAQTALDLGGPFAALYAETLASLPGEP